MPQCAVHACGNSHRRTRGKPVHYHRFPQEPEVRLKWIEACNRKASSNGEPPFNISTARICSRHFTRDCYEMIVGENDAKSFSSRLRRNVVPTIRLKSDEESSSEASPERENKREMTREIIRNAEMAAGGRNEPSCSREEAGDTGGPRARAERPPSARQLPSRKLLPEELSEGHRSTGSIPKVSRKKYVFMRALALAPRLNKMHAMEGASGNGKNVDAAENAPNTSPKVPQSQQNGAALPEETAASPSALDYGRVKIEKDVKINKKSLPVTSTPIASTSQQKAGSSRLVRSKSAEIVGKKRKSPDVLRDSTNGPPKPKKSCCSFEERETSIKSLVGEDRTADALRMRESELLKRMQFLEKLAKDKEKEWNQILYTRKLTEEAYVRIQRKKHMMRLTNSTTQLDDVPPTSLEAKWLNSDGTSMETGSRERTFEFKSDLSEESSLNASSTKKQNVAKAARQSGSSKSGGENSRKQSEQTSSPETRQIGEGRQGARVEVTSIIANHRKMFPDPAPKRGRRTRNAVNVNLTAGGALVETGHNADSRPSSTDSCKSNPSATECQNVNFKDMVLQFNRLSQHTVGEPARAPQNYPDVTLQPVPSGHNASPVPENTTAPSRSLLHGILTNNTSSRPNNFPLTLAKLLTAPERERNSPAVAAVTATTPMVPMSQQSASTQHLLQAYQGSSLGSISELLSSPTARTEITITPVVNTPAQSHSNNVINVDDVEEDTAASDDRDGRYSMSGRDTREDRDNPPRCQGCHQRAAQFVCAGCANQWYCSRECQVASWDEHSEICSG
ncbi:PREDICTED: uncharacterized protein LOC106751400 isoform X3 [Dinoponera quadriceps]|uniref:Uncharacterized protein LOC106751400 isoform X3 n=1 Tax=Dinoponera quadriceps TaxID=609295 RepID=A0A6P3YBL3_DINQU|nr:PREDICTED: uncharacterized protein LOC106751400 isoform X3 [Dinoponera quadriceps]